MNTDQKISALQILTRMPFKNKGEKDAQRMLVDALKKDLIPKESLPLELTEVYRDKPHVKTTHKTWPEVMARIEKVREDEYIYAIHVTRQGRDDGKTDYSWEAEKK